MKHKSIVVGSFVAILCALSALSNPEPRQDAKPKTGLRAKEPISPAKELADKLVLVAVKRYSAGNLEAADKILQAALEIDEHNDKACRLLISVQKASYARKHPQVTSPEVWYPTMPPRRARK